MEASPRTAGAYRAQRQNNRATSRAHHRTIYPETIRARRRDLVPTGSSTARNAASGPRKLAPYHPTPTRQKGTQLQGGAAAPDPAAYGLSPPLFQPLTAHAARGGIFPAPGREGPRTPR
jgi:hypothetical protein